MKCNHGALKLELFQLLHVEQMVLKEELENVLKAKMKYNR